MARGGGRAPGGIVVGGREHAGVLHPSAVSLSRVTAAAGAGIGGRPPRETAPETFIASGCVHPSLQPSGKRWAATTIRIL